MCASISRRRSSGTGVVAGSGTVAGSLSRFAGTSQPRALLVLLIARPAVDAAAAWLVVKGRGGIVFWNGAHARVYARARALLIWMWLLKGLRAHRSIPPRIGSSIAVVAIMSAT